MTNESKKLAFLGLGVMGYPMAGHLARAGHEVTVYNRSPAKADAWRNEYRGRTARTPAEAARSAEIVLMCVGNDDDVRTVANGADGALAGMAAGTILVDHTTASAEVAREVHAAAAARGVGFLDAPVSGGQAGAQNGKLTIMVGGDAATFAAAEARTVRIACSEDGRGVDFVYRDSGLWHITEPVAEEADQAQVVRLVEENHLADRVVISSFNPLALWRVRRLNPWIPVGMLYCEGLPFFLTRPWLRHLVRPDAMHPEWKMVDADYVRWARKRGYRVHTWTVDDPGRMWQLVEAGVDIIITNRPDLLRQVLQAGHEPGATHEPHPGGR